MSQQAFPCFHNQCRDIRGFCHDIDSALCSSLCCNINLNVVVFFPYCSLTSCCDKISLVTTEFLPSSCLLCRNRSFFVDTGASLSRQFLPCVDILLKNLSQHKLSLSQLTCYILPNFCCDTLSFVAIELICQYSDFCVATKEILS